MGQIDYKRWGLLEERRRDKLVLEVEWLMMTFDRRSFQNFSKFLLLGVLTVSIKGPIHTILIKEEFSGRFLSFNVLMFLRGHYLRNIDVRVLGPQPLPLIRP